MAAFTQPPIMLDSLGVEPLLADHDKAPASLLPRLPRPVELMLDALAHTLNDKPHRLARHLGITFDPQNVMRSRRARHLLQEFLRRARRRQFA